MKKAIVNGKIILADGMIENGMILMEDARILSCGPMDPSADLSAFTPTDARGAIVGPGFVDVHCHGGGGAMSTDSAGTAAAAHLAHGTTSLLITFAYNQLMKDVIRGVHETVEIMEAGTHPSIAGIHMEGPYINKKYGAQSGKAKNIVKEEYLSIIEAGKGRILLWTLAPELDGIDPVIDELEKNGILISVGHSEACPERIFELVPRGLNNACHTTNAMPVLTMKDGVQIPEAGAAVLLDDRIYAEIIPDRNGVHVHPLVIRLVQRLKGPDKVIIITDGTDYSGVSSSDPADAGTRIVDDVRYVDGELSGSCLTMDRAARNYKNHTGCSWVDVFKAASLNPAAMLGIHHEVGSIAPGKKANLVIMDEDFNIRKTIINGISVEPAAR